jgi:hypothetical protein
MFWDWQTVPAIHTDANANFFTTRGINESFVDDDGTYNTYVFESIGGVTANRGRTNLELSTATFYRGAEVTIAAGAITVTNSHHTVDTEAEATSDILTTITWTGVVNGQLLLLRPANDARTIIVTRAGNIYTRDGADFLMDDSSDYIVFVYDSDYGFIEIARSQVNHLQHQIISGTLTAGNANAFAFAWRNLSAKNLIISRVIIDVTTAGGTANAVLDVGTAADGTTTSSNLIDGMDLNTTGVYDNLDNAGTNGKSKQKLTEYFGGLEWVTGQILVANAANLAGKYYIYLTAV